MAKHNHGTLAKGSYTDVYKRLNHCPKLTSFPHPTYVISPSIHPGSITQTHRLVCSCRNEFMVSLTGYNPMPLIEEVSWSDNRVDWEKKGSDRTFPVFQCRVFAAVWKVQLLIFLGMCLMTSNFDQQVTR